MCSSIRLVYTTWTQDTQYTKWSHNQTKHNSFLGGFFRGFFLGLFFLTKSLLSARAARLHAISNDTCRKKVSMTVCWHPVRSARALLTGCQHTHTHTVAHTHTHAHVHTHYTHTHIHISLSLSPWRTHRHTHALTFTHTHMHTLSHASRLIQWHTCQK